MSRRLDLNRYREKLNALRDQLLSHDSQPITTTGDPGDVPDSGDLASQQIATDESVGLAEHQSLMRKEIDDALERIDAGTFGTCENCQGAIGAQRLNAIPYARYCVQCERQFEQNA
jgi:DnaK suppressor protein